MNAQKRRTNKHPHNCGNKSGHELRRLVIIADDLTGALDSAAPFAARGLSTIVATGPEGIVKALAANSQVVAVSTQSRDLAIQDAVERVKCVLAHLPEGVRLFKKIDSRLKGHVEDELNAIPFRTGIVLPALPEFGRVVKDGQLSGFGITTPIPVVSSLGTAAERVQIPDTRTSQDLVDALTFVSDETLLIGARGLAEALAQSMTGKQFGPKPFSLKGPLTIVVGSHDPITMEQVRILRRGAIRIRDVKAPNGQAQICLDCPLITLVQAVQGNVIATANEVAVALAKSVTQTYIEGRVALVLTGGATAEAILRQMGVECLEVQGEILPGMPVSLADGRMIVTKSGGFGTRDALMHLARQVMRSA